MALALRVSMEEQRARQEAENASGGGTTATTEQGQADKPETAASGGGAEEDPVLARALGKEKNHMKHGNLSFFCTDSVEITYSV